MLVYQRVIEVVTNQKMIHKCQIVLFSGSWEVDEINLHQLGTFPIHQLQISMAHDALNKNSTCIINKLLHMLLRMHVNHITHPPFLGLVDACSLVGSVGHWPQKSAMTTATLQPLGDHGYCRITKSQCS